MILIVFVCVLLVVCVGVWCWGDCCGMDYFVLVVWNGVVVFLWLIYVIVWFDWCIG